MTTPQATNPPFKKKMVITDQSELARWTKNAEEKVIYEIQAVNENGQAINKKLRTFQPELPQGELIEFEVKEYIHEEHGRTFTLRMPSKGKASKKEMSELKSQMAALANRVGALESQLADVQGQLQRGKSLDPVKQREADDAFGKKAPF